MAKQTNKPKYKTVWSCVAIAGATTDGREISSEWIQQMADSYDPKVYGARINLEHFRSASPDSSFGAYGDVLALKTEQVTINGVEKDALFAQIQPNQNLLDLNKKNQKIYTSIEVNPNFAKTGKAYLVGLAVTDSPASLGTEQLKFAAGAGVNPLASRKQDPNNLFVESYEVAVEFSEHKPTFDFLSKFYQRFTKQEELNGENEDKFSQYEQAIIEVAERVESEGDKTQSLEQKYNALQQEFNQLKAKLEKEPAHTPRPPATNSFNHNEDDVVDC